MTRPTIQAALLNGVDTVFAECDLDHNIASYYNVLQIERVAAFRLIHEVLDSIEYASYMDYDLEHTL